MLHAYANCHDAKISLVIKEDEKDNISNEHHTFSSTRYFSVISGTIEYASFLLNKPSHIQIGI